MVKYFAREFTSNGTILRFTNGVFYRILFQENVHIFWLQYLIFINADMHPLRIFFILAIQSKYVSTWIVYKMLQCYTARHVYFFKTGNRRKICNSSACFEKHRLIFIRCNVCEFMFNSNIDLNWCRLLQAEYTHRYTAHIECEYYSVNTSNVLFSFHSWLFGSYSLFSQLNSCSSQTLLCLNVRIK